jgi:hypothetical protein
MILIKRPALFFKQGIESSLQKTNTEEHHYEIVKNDLLRRQLTRLVPNG